MTRDPLAGRRPPRRLGQGRASDSDLARQPPLAEQGAGRGAGGRPGRAAAAVCLRPGFKSMRLEV